MSGYSPYNEKELLTRISNGDEQAFATIYRHYYQYMQPFLQKFTGSATTAEEIIQETFLDVWLNRDKLPEILHFKSWLYTIASRKNLMLLRKELRRKEKINQAFMQSEADLSADAPSPYDRLELQEMQTLVQQAINNLSPQRKKIYQLSREKDYSADEIAALLNLTPQTVHNTLTAALKQIREHLIRTGRHFPVLIGLLLKIF